MNPKNRLLFLLITIGFCFNAVAQYTTSAARTYMDGGTNNVAASSTNTYAHDISVDRSNGAFLFVSCKALAAHTGEVIFVFSRAGSYESVETAQTFRVSLTCAGTSTVNLATNLTIGHERFLRLKAVENATAVGVTNVTVIVSTKR